MFSLILLREIKNEPNFIKLSHVCFADDLLVMCHGDITYVKVIKKDLDSFSAHSGRIPNTSKSTVLFESMNEEDKTAIGYVFPFSIGKLPVRCLGVPLIAKRLGVKDCGCLLDKIKNKIQSWKNKYLSYAGRLQLIAAVLEFIHNQSENTTGKAKVAWSIICKPKDQGGLGLKNLQSWNLALLAKHVWNIANNKESLWVKWVHYVKLRGQSIWEVKEDNDNSWGWRNLLYLTYRDLYDKRLSESLKVSNMIVNGRWSWLEEWSNKFPLITSLEVHSIEEEREDKIVWKTRFGKEVEFPMRQVNIDFTIQNHKVPWWKLVWYSQCIPKQSFILWLATGQIDYSRQA
nr:hypothetical protein [Tanacetum cinerariifolium]